ncbi:sugar phosphate isomerase/epimerase [Paenibacillus lycopersici]|uniref:Sugar phosphate isomerase/epimerase n=1 Tax=Paenibacillus lycopersici TaxID=2704462 RepID=A0A6C0G1D4_9BACL|nr:sugar phosphate isomerase/epimerase [Paenibacillus lycopersici]QHT61184.1 sugar phosphate isomerase/epimerase [Paenibacillus lycopersici]
MEIGFYHACFPEWDPARTFAWASRHGFRGIELHGGQRYRFLNWRELAEGKGAGELLKLQEASGIPLIGIMYGAIPFLSPNPAERAEAADTIATLLRAARNLGIEVVSTFTGRDPSKTLEANLDLFGEVFRPIADTAERLGVKLAFENCPMLDHWPPAHNIAVSPFMWTALFERVPSPALGLNIDPSHLGWQGIDAGQAVRDFKDRIFAAQAKDTEVLPDVLRHEGMLTNRWWRHRLPGQGDVDWNGYITALHEIGYAGVLSIEHEDPVWSGSEDKVERGLLLAKRYLEQYI